jgi:hypothetical protein
MLEIAVVPLTPRIVVIAARGGIALATAGAIVIGGTETAPPSSAMLPGGGWGLSLLALMAFPRVRKNDLLFPLAGCSAAAGYLTAAPGLDASLWAVAAGASGPLAVALTLSLMYVRYQAASNQHMSFVEWRQLDRRKRRADTKLPAVPGIPIQNDG